MPCRGVSLPEMGCPAMDLFCFFENYDPTTITTTATTTRTTQKATLWQRLYKQAVFEIEIEIDLVISCMRGRVQ